MNDPGTSRSHSGAPRDLAQWGLHAFCLGARSTPQAVVMMDDNGRILHEAVGGTTVARLRGLGITPAESQLALLRAYHLLEIDGTRLTTTFPAVGPQALTRLRTGTRIIADDLIEALSPEVEALCAELHRRGHHDHDYTVVFGHAVDGLVWDELRPWIPDTHLSIDRPFWNGAFWAIHPPRDDAAGVNEHAGARGSLVAVWSRPASPRLRTMLAREAAALVRNADDALPVVRTDGTDPIHRHGRRIARRLADSIAEDERCLELRDRICAGPAEALLILAHELIWDVMDALVDSTPMSRPPGLDTETATTSELRRLLFIRS